MLLSHAHTCAGRFGFVEMRTDELATSAMQLDKVRSARVLQAACDGVYCKVVTQAEAGPTQSAAVVQVEVCGRSINVGRPKGYVEPAAGARPSNIGAAQMFAQTLTTNAPTRVLLLSNMLKAPQMLDDTERNDVRPAACLPASSTACQSSIKCCTSTACSNMSKSLQAALHEKTGKWRQAHSSECGCITGADNWQC